MKIHYGARSLCTGHTLRTPERTSQNFSNKYNISSQYEDSTYGAYGAQEEYDEVDEAELEKLRLEHRESARNQHKAKEGYVIRLIQLFQILDSLIGNLRTPLRIYVFLMFQNNVF